MQTAEEKTDFFSDLFLEEERCLIIESKTRLCFPEDYGNVNNNRD